MPRKNVTFKKPAEPSFIRKLKEQAGFKEGPSVDTKKEDLGPVSEEDLQDTADEQPTVVVLEPGDLTAEEAVQIKEELFKEIEETPADLTAPIVFKAPNKDKKADPPAGKKRPGSSEHSKSSKKIKNKTLLSFDEEENDD